MRRPAFTIIELLITVGIIALIATTAFYSLGTARSKSRDGKRLADFESFRQALQLAIGQMGSYPAGTDVVLGTPGYQVICAQGNTVKFAASPDVANCDRDKIYMSNIPQGPVPHAYRYTSASVTTSFQICTSLENNDPKLGLNAGPIQVSSDSSIKNVASCP